MNGLIQVLGALLAQTPPPAGPAAPAPGALSTAWDMVVKGGWSMYPLALCSLAAMTIVVERLVVTRRARVVPPTLREELRGLRGTPGEARARCQASAGVPLAGVVLAAIDAQGERREVADRLVSEALGKTERLAQGIYEAWTATAVGLVVAIPTIVMYQVLLSRIDAAAAALDEAAQEWLKPDPAALPVAPAPVSLPNPAGNTKPGPARAAATP